MTLYCQNMHKQDRKCQFSKRLIENNAFAIFMSNENFGSTSWYHDGTTMVPRWYYDGTTMVIALQISTVLATLCQMKWCDVIKLMIQHFNQNQQAESFQRRRACIVHLFFVSKQQILTRDRQVWIGKDKVVIIGWAEWLTEDHLPL